MAATNKSKKFKTKILSQGPSEAWTMIEVPFNVEKEWGSKARVSVKGTINGFAFESSIFPNGDGTHHMMLNKAILTGTNAKAGDSVQVEMQPDTAPRVYEAPADLAKVLAKNGKAKATWEALAPGKKKYSILWIEEAKKEETRAARVAKAVEILNKGKSPK